MTATRRPTRQRTAVLELLHEQDTFRSAQDIHAVLREAGTGIGLATVYRTLQAMATDGDVDVLRTEDGESVYRRCRTPRHHHHLVCRSCGLTVEVEDTAGGAVGRDRRRAARLRRRRAPGRGVRHLRGVPRTLAD